MSFSLFVHVKKITNLPNYKSPYCKVLMFSFIFTSTKQLLIHCYGLKQQLMNCFTTGSKVGFSVRIRHSPCLSYFDSVVFFLSNFNFF